MSRFTENYLLYLLAQASHKASAEFHAELALEGIAVGTWRVLACLHPDLTLSVGDLSRECLIQPSTLSRTLDRLARDGLLCRQATDQDRRQVHVCLTQKGVTLSERLILKAKQNEQQLLNHYTDEENLLLKNALKLLTCSEK